MQRVVCFALLVGSVAGAVPPTKHTAAPIAKHAAAPVAKSAGKLRGAKKDVSAVPAQLSQMMAAAQHSLAIAEKHHEKAVEKARGEETDMLSKQANALGTAIQRFAAELDRSTAVLQKAVNASKAVLALKEPESSGFESALVQARAHVSAEVDAAEREVRRQSRKREHLVHEAITNAGNALEDGSTKLSRRIGDLSELVNDAKSSLEAIATGSASADSDSADSDSDDGSSPAANATAANATTANATAANATVANKTVSAQALPKVADKKIMDSTLTDLAAAKKESRSIADAAEKKLAKDIAQADSDVVKEVAGITKELQDAEKKEIAKVRGKPKFFF